MAEWLRIDYKAKTVRHNGMCRGCRQSRANKGARLPGHFLCGTGELAPDERDVYADLGQFEAAQGWKYRR